MKSFCAMSVAILVAACGSGAAPDANATASSAFMPPATEMPEPVAGQRQTTPLTAYVGRYPRDAVDGVSFFDRTDVASALIDTVPEEPLRRTITGRDATQVPIFRKGALVAAHGCEASNCGGHNWTVLVASDGNHDLSAVCHHDAATMGPASRWSTRRGSETRPGECPQA